MDAAAWTQPQISSSSDLLLLSSAFAFAFFFFFFLQVLKNRGKAVLLLIFFSPGFETVEKLDSRQNQDQLTILLHVATSFCYSWHLTMV